MTDSEIVAAYQKITRFEVIDQHGRSYVNYMDARENISYSLQDDNRTLKVFITREK